MIVEERLMRVEEGIWYRELVYTIVGTCEEVIAQLWSQHDARD
jgi:hypothetical protein